MLFNSVEYLLFFCSVLALSWLTVGLPRVRIWILLLASYYFYVSNNHWLILLILASTQIDFVAGLAIAGTQNQVLRKRWLVASVVTNLGILGTFKYFNFFAQSVADIAQASGVTLDWVDLNIALPVGISFYTFQSMSYTIDVYREKIPVERSWLRFSFFVAFFPQLIAGPIVRASEFLEQTHVSPKLNAEELDEAMLRIFRGLFKKAVVADFLGIYADAAFSSPGQVDTLAAWVGVYAFAFQIYFDFSAYTDIAIGCARLMGYRFPENFRQPYMASSITDFWRRWHISLSSWLRDYLYIPLGGSRVATQSRVYRNLMITMILGGLWHGAAWHFVLWGFIHGSWLSVERMLGVGHKEPTARYPGLRTFLVFQGVVLTWIPFRAESNELMWELLRRLVAFDAPEQISRGSALVLAIVTLGWLAQWAAERFEPAQFMRRLPIPIKGLAYACVTATVVVASSESSEAFIYFRF